VVSTRERPSQVALERHRQRPTLLFCWPSVGPVPCGKSVDSPTVLRKGRRMTSSDVWDQETAEQYDVGSPEMFGPEVVGPTVDFLAGLAGDGQALEFAIGTGRIGLPLAARGVPVSGIELSEPMVHQLRKKPGGTDLSVAVGDMATTRVPGEFSLVFLVWNSISNLRTQDEQVECFGNAARHLRAGGRFVVELWVPQLRRLPEGQSVAVGSISPDHLIFDEFDLVTQGCISHHYRHNQDGTVRYGLGRFRYAWPAELDLMARMAGMRLEGRYADWTRSPFTSESQSHVSVWRLD
jgi:SAM-dependent methyltransferase